MAGNDYSHEQSQLAMLMHCSKPMATKSKEGYENEASQLKHRGAACAWSLGIKEVTSSVLIPPQTSVSQL